MARAQTFPVRRVLLCAPIEPYQTSDDIARQQDSNCRVGIRLKRENRRVCRARKTFFSGQDGRPNS